MNQGRNTKYQVMQNTQPDARHGETSPQEETINEKILAHTTALLRISNPVGNSKYINKAWIDYTGSTFSNEHDFTENMHPESRRLYKNAWQQAVSENKEFSITYMLLHRSGEYRWICEYTRPIYTNGVCEEYLCTGIDIHDYKAHDEHFINKWTSILRTNFHDLRGAIGIVSGASGLLQLMEKKEDRDYTLEMIRRNVTQIQVLMDQLLAQFASEKNEHTRNS
ncbi:PAS domain-containing protein [Dyadobacter sp. CY345]|uniref:PAS domain-containing protein n=1 Tax=Dyadobacter sp. CY345 TaxID=2909335 RepID=UPI001F45678F|nr:PAS domain-containing protein [Dyadobacter sp. CY345]MCF2446671.1 PAS domain-containing protein [Dyadobacter sp. CY345]